MVYHWQYIKIPDSGYPTCHAANLAILPNGQLAVVYFSGASEGSADSVNLLQHLQADGTWSQPQVVTSEVGRSAGNAVLMPVPDGRTLLFYTLSFSRESVTWADALIHYRVSDDNCRTWGPSRTVTEEFGYICRQPGLILSSGEWLHRSMIIELVVDRAMLGWAVTKVRLSSRTMTGNIGPGSGGCWYRTTLCD